MLSLLCSNFVQIDRIFPVPKCYLNWVLNIAVFEAGRQGYWHQLTVCSSSVMSVPWLCINIMRWWKVKSEKQWNELKAVAVNKIAAFIKMNKNV